MAYQNDIHTLEVTQKTVQSNKAWRTNLKLIVIMPDPCHYENINFVGVYIGSVSNAENKTMLKRLGITHILNCDGHPVLRPERQRRYEPASESGMK